jgi:pimeloyl-ACP methyl ester carboxylesterase
MGRSPDSRGGRASYHRGMKTASPAAAARIIAALLVAAGCARSEAPRTPEATMQSTYLEADPVLRMQVERIGSGQPLVLIGGGLTGWASWQPHAERLAATRDVARLQLLSVQYGLENRPLPDGYSVRTESRALAAALDELGWTQPLDLVAWSYGAAITLDFALNHPERVRTLTMIEPPALWVLPDHGRALPDVQELAALLPDVEEDVGIDALERFLHTAALVPPGTAPESLPQWESWVRHRRSLRNGDAVFRHDDDAARLRAFTAPVLLVTGHGTSTFLRAVTDTLATTLPNARTLELPGGHAPQLVAPDEFLARLAEFQASASGNGERRKHTVRSRDGTRIAFWRSGSGPPLLLVHGATADHGTTWRLVLAALERRFTVYAMDRRGRGESGDGRDYELQREAEDVAAVVEAIGEPVSVLGHSYGALAAIEAARLTTRIDRLILYEGVPLRGGASYDPGIGARLDALLEAGDVEGVLITMYRDLVEMPPEEIELLRGQREAWARRLANAPTLPRELEAESSYTFAPDRFGGVRSPTLLLVGEDSPPRELQNANGVAAALPDARVVVMPGQQHAAMHTAPDLFVDEIVRFLEGAR